MFAARKILARFARRLHSLTYLLVLAALINAPLCSQWSTDPSNNLIVAYGLLPELCSDSAGGAYVTYEVPTTYPRHLELRRLDRYGYQPWGSSRTIEGVWPEGRLASIASDGNNGVLIAYQDRLLVYPVPSIYASRVRVQRVDSLGNLLWGASGVRVSLDEHTQSEGWKPAIVPDGQGGCIVAWVDTANKLTIQRINVGGERMWGDSGVVVAALGSVYTPLMIPDGQEGCILVYDGPTMQRMDSFGNKLWGDGVLLNGIAVSDIVADDRGGALVTGMM